MIFIFLRRLEIIFTLKCAWCLFLGLSYDTTYGLLHAVGNLSLYGKIDTNVYTATLSVHDGMRKMFARLMRIPD